MNLRDLSTEQIQSELSENFRLRVGLWLIVVLFLSWLSLVWSDFNAGQYASIKNLERNQRALVDIESVEVWRERVNLEEDRVKRIEQTLWKASSDGLAKARLQAGLDELIVKDDFVKKSVKVGTPQPLDAVSVNRIRARVRVNVTPDQLVQTMTNIASYPQKLVVEELELNFRNGRWVVDLTVAAFFIYAEEAA